MNPKPNHPIEAAILEHGFNVIEIPLNWISSQDDHTIPFEIYPLSVEIYMAHEMSHADYFLINKLNTQGFKLIDHTHDPMILGYPSPTDYYLMYFMNLKAFWSYLTL